METNEHDREVQEILDNSSMGEALGDYRVATVLAKEFCQEYRPANADYLLEAIGTIDDTLGSTIPGCLTKEQMLNENIKALVFAAAAAKHGWVLSKPKNNE